MFNHAHTTALFALRNIVGDRLQKLDTLQNVVDVVSKLASPQTDLSRKHC